MKYMLLIYMAEDAMTEAERKSCYKESTRFGARSEGQRAFLAASPLHPASTATKVQHRNGKPIVTDGPYAETREHLGGYFLIDAPNLDDAIHIAARIPRCEEGHSRNSARA